MILVDLKINLTEFNSLPEDTHVFLFFIENPNVEANLSIHTDMICLMILKVPIIIVQAVFSSHSDCGSI